MSFFDDAFLEDESAFLESLSSGNTVWGREPRDLAFESEGRRRNTYQKTQATTTIQKMISICVPFQDSGDASVQARFGQTGHVSSVCFIISTNTRYG